MPFKRLMMFVVLIAALLAPATAGALTVSPSGSYSSTATGSVLFGFSSTRQLFTCTNTTWSYSVDGSGAGSSPAGSSSYSNCNNAIMGSFRFTQASAWTVNVALAAGPVVKLQIAIPARGLAVEVGLCRFTLTGSYQLQRSYGALPASVAVTDTFAVASSALTIDSLDTMYCNPLLYSLNLAMTYSGTYTFNRAFTVSG